MKGSAGLEGNLMGALEESSQNFHIADGVLGSRRTVFFTRTGHSQIQMDRLMNFAITGINGNSFPRTNSDFVEVIDGIWMPLKTESILPQEDQTTIYTAKVRRIKFNNGYTAKDFRIKFAPGIEVRDLDSAGNEPSELPSESSVLTRPKLETRIYDVFELVAVRAGSKELALNAIQLVQKIQADIEPQSWRRADGQGLCTVLDGSKLYVRTTQEIHGKIDLYMNAIRQYGGFLDESLLPDDWALEYSVSDESSEPNGASLIAIKMVTGQRRPNEECTLKVTTFSGEQVMSISSTDAEKNS